MLIRFSTLFIVIFTLACAKKTAPPAPIIVREEAPQKFISDIVVNYKLDKTGIKDTFNRSINETFKAPFNIPEYDIKLTLSKPKEATVEIEGKQVTVNVPVGILVEKKTVLADLKAKGLLDMQFVAQIDLDSLWNFKSVTKLVKHNWVEQPKLSVAGLSLPIETISNAVLKKTRADIEATIDESLKSSFTIRQVMTEQMRMFDAAIRPDPSTNAYLHLQPQRIFLNKVKNSKTHAIGKVSMRLENKLSTLAIPSVKTPLAKLQWSETIPDSSTIRLMIDMQVSDLNQILATNFNGQTFDSGDKKITLNNTLLSTDYDLMTVSTDVSGSINGTLIIKGRPLYDGKKNEFYMDVKDIGLKSKNVALKTVAWLAEGKIRKELEANLHFPLDVYVKEAQQMVNTQMADFNKKYEMGIKVGLGKMDIERFDIKPGKINALVRNKFYLEMVVKDLRSFGNM